MTHRDFLPLALLLLAGAAAPAAAQTATTAAPAHGFVGIDAGYQSAPAATTTTATYTLNLEDASVTATYEGNPGPVFGARGGIRVWKGLAIGGGVAVFRQTGNAQVSARLPHPFYLNDHREGTITLGGFDRRETLVALEASWIVQAGSRTDVMVFGGPAFFTASRTVAGEVRYTESYPYDEISITDAERRSESASATGFTVGADVSYRFSRTVGVGGLVRYARASASFGSGSETAAVDLGGLQASGGIRFRF